jgi:dihydrofolate reductase
MVSYTADMFMTLDGFGTGPVGYWGKEGPELIEHRANVFFGGDGETLVFGANTYRAMERFAAEQAESPEFTSLTKRAKVVISRTLKEPLGWDNTRLVTQDALEAVPRLKAESPLPLRSHGSISMNRALLAAGLVDRLEITAFPIITGASGSDPIHLELVDARLLDGRIQQLVYIPTVLEAPLG